MPDLSDQPASVAECRALRGVAGLSVFSVQAATKALDGTLHAAWLRHDRELVGMARAIGDGGCFVRITDVAISPTFQRQGWGKVLMAHLMAWAETRLPPDCYVSLRADPGAERLYERFGFTSRHGMARLAPG